MGENSQGERLNIYAIRFLIISTHNLEIRNLNSVKVRFIFCGDADYLERVALLCGSFFKFKSYLCLWLHFLRLRLTGCVILILSISFQHWDLSLILNALLPQLCGSELMIYSFRILNRENTKIRSLPIKNYEFWSSRGFKKVFAWAFYEVI